MILRAVQMVLLARLTTLSINSALSQNADRIADIS